MSRQAMDTEDINSSGPSTTNHEQEEQKQNNDANQDLVSPVMVAVANNNNNNNNDNDITHNPLDGENEEKEKEPNNMDSSEKPTSRINTHFEPRVAVSVTFGGDNDDDDQQQPKEEEEKKPDANEEEDSIIALLTKVSMKAAKDKKEADKHPTSVEEAEKMHSDLEKRKDSQKKHLMMLAGIDVNDKNRKAYSEAAKAIESAYKSTKQGVERSKTVVQMSRFVLPARETKKLQICFCFDATGSLSMGNIIGVLKDTMLDITHKVQSASSLPVEIGFVCYRDYDDRHRFEACNFTTNVEKIVDKLSKIKAQGGGDDAEDCLGALDAVIQRMKWKPIDNSIRVCCWCGDAPGHGLIGPSRPADFKDDYPEGDKFGLTVQKIVSGLVKENIILAFLRVNNTTDYMIEQFRMEMMNERASTYTLPVADLTDVSNTQMMVDQLLIQCSAVSTTTRHRRAVQRSEVRRMDSGDSNNNNNNEDDNDANDNDFSSFSHDMSFCPPKRESGGDKNRHKPEKAKLHGRLFAVTPIQLHTEAFNMAKSDIRTFIQTVISAKTLQELPPARSTAMHSTSASLNVEVPYFATGGNKYAHLASLSSSSSSSVDDSSSSSSQQPHTRVIAKDFVEREGNDVKRLMSKHLNDVKAITIAQALASLFCECLEINTSALEFIHRSIFVAETNDNNDDEKKAATMASKNNEEKAKHPSLSNVYSIEPLLPVLVDDAFSPAAAESSSDSSETRPAAKMSKMTSYNSNGGFQDASFDLIQAFSHFTWHITDGRLMVLDLKGCHEEKEKRFFRLLVPAIQTKDFSMFPSITNIGEEAMADFLKVHHCGPMCRACGIPALRTAAAAAATSEETNNNNQTTSPNSANPNRLANFGRPGSAGGDGGVNVLVGPPTGYTGGGGGGYTVSGTPNYANNNNNNGLSMPPPQVSPPALGYFEGVPDDGMDYTYNYNNNVGGGYNNAAAVPPNNAFSNGGGAGGIPMAIPFIPQHYNNNTNMAVPASYLPAHIYNPHAIENYNPF